MATVYGRRSPTVRRVGAFVAAVVVGPGVGSLLLPDPVAIPQPGTVPEVLVGAFGFGTGGALYLGSRRLDGGDAYGVGDSRDRTSATRE